MLLVDDCLIALQYLYLLFDEDNPLHRDDSNYVLTTEGHILAMDRKLQKPISAIRRELRRVEHLECPAYRPPMIGTGKDRETGLTQNIYSRGDMEYPRELIQAPSTEAEEAAWSAYGWCSVPRVDLYVCVTLQAWSCTRIDECNHQSYDFLLSPDGRSVVEDLHPSQTKLVAVSDGYIMHNVTRIRAHIVSRMDGKGYDITKRTSLDIPRIPQTLSVYAQWAHTA